MRGELIVQDTFFSVFAQKEAKRFKLKVGVFLFLIQNEHLLMLRRHQTGIDDNLYLVPMGAHDGKESLSEAMKREAYEEAGIILHPKELVVCHVMHRYHPMPQGLSFEQIDVFFKANRYDGRIENKEPDKCNELAFYPLNDLPVNTASFIQQAIVCMERGDFFSEFGWENTPKKSCCLGKNAETSAG